MFWYIYCTIAAGDQVDVQGVHTLECSVAIKERML